MLTAGVLWSGIWGKNIMRKVN